MPVIPLGALTWEAQRNPTRLHSLVYLGMGPDRVPPKMTDQGLTEVDTRPACKATNEDLTKEDPEPACKETEQGLSEEDVRTACKEGHPITKVEHAFITEQWWDSVEGTDRSKHRESYLCVCGVCVGVCECAVWCVCIVCVCICDYMMQQTMLRVKDPVKSLDFYTRILGLTLLQKIDFPSMHFTLYYLGYEDKKGKKA
ncbi:hypothetical protein NFI96_031727 [Prochilodus magdalenae]|nr:hypothetical protein NFI96_031727 [Prochilodus magdalenae]